MKTPIEKVNIEDFDKERAKTDLVYFATHCLIDAKTGKPFEWNSAQIEVMRRITEMEQECPTEPSILLTGKYRTMMWKAITYWLAAFRQEN